MKSGEKKQSSGKIDIALVDVSNLPESHRAFHRLRLVDDMKHELCRLPIATENEENKEDEEKQGDDAPKRSDGLNQEPRSFELPDGHTITLSATDYESIPEMLFNPPEEITKMVGISQMAHDVAAACDTDVRRELFGGVVLTGGSSLFPGVTERFQRDLAFLTPQMFKAKLIAPASSIERTCGPWIGGSILSSLGTFHQLWMSKKEYDEHGANGILRRCP